MESTFSQMILSSPFRYVSLRFPEHLIKCNLSGQVHSSHLGFNVMSYLEKSFKGIGFASRYAFTLLNGAFCEMYTRIRRVPRNSRLVRI